MLVKYNNKKIRIDAREVKGFGTVSGLMFKSKNTGNLFFRKVFGIHSFFVFFDFLAVWLNSDGDVLKVDVVKPFSFNINSPEGYRGLIEIPINNRNRKNIELLVGEGKV